ncbi:hypothetical protein Tco_0888336 [Tanacetum coccineum]
MDTTRIDTYLQGTPTDQTKYQSMIGIIMYLTTSRPDISFATFVCARYQESPTEKHLKEVNRIFRYLKQTYNMGLCYSKDFGFELIVYSDVNLAGCHDDYKSTSGGIQFLGDKLVIWSSKKQDSDQLVTTKYQGIGRCNNYAILSNILCLKECKIADNLLVDHPLSYALTATADVLAVHLQQFWKTVKPVVNANETIQFKVDRQEITYTIDMFRDTLKLLVETPTHPFIAPATLKFIQPFMKIVGY